MNFQRDLTKRRGRPKMRKMDKPPLGQRLYEERLKRGWSLDQAASEARDGNHALKRGTIYAIEEGISGQPRRDALIAFSELYGVPLEELAVLAYANNQEAPRRPKDATIASGKTSATTS